MVQLHSASLDALGHVSPLHACRAVEAAAESASDVVGRAFWWSNCIQLRWMLWAMSHGGSLDSEYGQELGGSVDDFDWVMQVWLRMSNRDPTGSAQYVSVAKAAICSLLKLSIMLPSVRWKHEAALPQQHSAFLLASWLFSA